MSRIKIELHTNRIIHNMTYNVIEKSFANILYCECRCLWTGTHCQWQSSGTAISLQWENGWGSKRGSQIVEKVQNLLFRDRFVFTFRLFRGVECKKRPQKSNFQRILSRPMSCQLFLRSKNKKIRTFLENFYGSWWYPMESLHLWLHAPLSEWSIWNPKIPLKCDPA